MFTPTTAAALFQLMVEQYNAESAVTANTDTGSTLAAIFEAAVLLSLQLQQEIIYLFQISRIATSTGQDLDNALNPFGFFRLGPNTSSGVVTATYTAGPAQTIQVGAIVQTQNGVLFQVVADPNNTTGDYNSITQGYTNNPVITFLVQSVATGLVGNVLANTITLPFTGSGVAPIPGSPVITNPNAFNNAVANESDDAFRIRFANFISGGSGGNGTENAIIAAIQGFEPAVNSGLPTGQALTFSYGDLFNYSPTGSPPLQANIPGTFTVVAAIANSGSLPPSGLCPALQQWLLPIHAGGIKYAVIPPNLLKVNANGSVVIKQGYSQFTVIPAVDAAYIAYVNGLGLDPFGNATVISPFSVYVALSQVPGVERIDGLLLNGGLQDIFAPFGTMLVAGNANFVYEMVC